MGNMFCRGFFVSSGPFEFPHPPTTFVLRVQSFYESVFSDFQSGELGLFEPTTNPWLGIFSILNNDFRRGRFSNGIYFVGPSEPRYCIKEIVQKGRPNQSYVSCSNKSSSRREFEEFRDKAGRIEFEHLLRIVDKVK